MLIVCVCMLITHACVCLIVDFSVANPSVGSTLCPNGDVFSADITSPGRPLIRSQSFHNAPGTVKGPLALPLVPTVREEARHCLLFQHTEKLFQFVGKE